MKNALLIALAVFIGFASLTLFTAIAQEVFFDGISFTNSPLPSLIIGGGLSVLGAVLAGALARLVYSPYKIIVPIIISIFIVADTTNLIVNDITVDPAWFDIAAGISLIIGVWFGYYYIKKVSQTFKKS
jgi:hypothetical protein